MAATAHARHTSGSSTLQFARRRRHCVLTVAWFFSVLTLSGWVIGMGTSITREIRWDPELESLLSLPVPEVAALRGKVLGAIVTPTPLAPGELMTLVSSGATVADIEIVLGVPTSATNVTIDVCGAVTLTLTVGDALGPSGRRTVTLGGRVPTMIGAPKLELKTGETTIDARLLVDGNVVEIFVGGGRAVVTAPGLTLAAPGSVSVSAATAGVSVHNATAWAMRSVFGL